VNANGYLIDIKGNIIDKHSGQPLFKYYELMFQEPPKIFDFTEFDISWIKGRMNYDVTKNKRHNDEYDLDGRRINTQGYCID